jgi:hypothetical protein
MSKKDKHDPPQYAPAVSSSPMPSQFGTFDFTELHHYQFLWVPQAQNGGANGILEWFIDYQPQVIITYSSTGLSNPPLSPSAENGELSQGQSAFSHVYPDRSIRDRPSNQYRHLSDMAASTLVRCGVWVPRQNPNMPEFTSLADLGIWRCSSAASRPCRRLLSRKSSGAAAAGMATSRRKL